MSKTKPLFGSKISLISKAEIRYEGTLYEVDAENSTVTLAKVRSFGTEGRQAAKQIQPRNEVYEYIIFRGNDIKDLNVSNIPGQQSESSDPPQDPAIVSAHTLPPPSLLTPGSMVSQSPGPPLPHLTPVPTMPPGPGGVIPPQSSHPYYARPPAPGGYSAFGMPYFRPPMMMGAAGGSRHPQPSSLPHQNASPQPSSRASPQTSVMNSSLPGHLVAVVPPHGSQVAESASDQAVVTSTSLGPELSVSPIIAPTGTDNKPQASSTPLVAVSDSDVLLTPTVNSVPTSAVQPLDHEPPIVSAHSPSAASRARAPQHKQQQHRKVESAGSHLPSTVQATHGSTSSKPTRDGGQGKKTAGGGGWGSVHQDDVDSSAAQSGGGRNKQSWRSSRDQGQRDGGGGRGSGRNYSSGGYVNSGRGNSRSRRENYRGGHGNGGGGRRPEGHQNQERPPDRTTYKYDSEFDFESANARFNKEGLEQEFKHKLRLDDHSRKPSESSSRKASVGSGHDFNESSGEEAEIIEDSESVSDEVEEYYDKTKSFFDNISCETNAASGRRPTRNEEREVNTETFGVSSVNNNYGYYRYRRNWRGRGRGDYRGGRGDYRGGRGDYRGGRGDYRGGRGDYRGGRGDYRGGRGDYRGGRGDYRGGRGGDQGRGGGDQGRGGGRGRYRNDDEGQYRGRGGGRGHSRGGGSGRGDYRNNYDSYHQPNPL